MTFAARDGFNWMDKDIKTRQKIATVPVHKLFDFVPEFFRNIVINQILPKISLVATDSKQTTACTHALLCLLPKLNHYDQFCQ